MLSKQERMFVDAFDGDPTYAARIAGFAGADAYIKVKAEKLLKLPHIIEAIQDRAKYTLKSKNVIATREERQAMWTSIMMNEDPYHKQEVENGIPIPEGNIPLTTRLKASELLGKSEADFVDKIQMDVHHSLSELIQQSYIDDTPIEAIEAEYYRIKNNTLPPPTLEDIL